MSPALRRCLFALTTITLLVPLLVSAALPPSGSEINGSGKSQDACKSGSLKTEAGKGGAISGGDTRTKNYIDITKSGSIQVSCRLIQEGEPATVVFCDLENKCWSADKNSKKGESLMQLYNSAYEEGSPLRSRVDGGIILGARRIDPETLLENMLPREQMVIINEKIIGKVDQDNRLYDYSQIVDWAAWKSSGSSQPEDSFESAAIMQIESMAFLAREPKPSPYSDLPINMDLSLKRDWMKPIIIDFLPLGESARLMNELIDRSQKNTFVPANNTFETQFVPITPVLATPPTSLAQIDTPIFSSGWFTRAYNAFVQSIFGKQSTRTPR